MMKPNTSLALHPALRTVFGLFVLTTFLGILKVLWMFDEAPQLSIQAKVFSLIAGAAINAAFYGWIAYKIYRGSSRFRYGYSFLTMASFAYYTLIVFIYYWQNGSLAHTDLRNLIVLAPQLLGALLLFNPDLDDYFSQPDTSPKKSG